MIVAYTTMNHVTRYFLTHYYHGYLAYSDLFTAYGS